MIIDARKQSHSSFRQLTALGAIACHLSNLDSGDVLVVDNVIDVAGRALTKQAIRMSLNKINERLNIKTASRLIDGKIHIFVM